MYVVRLALHAVTFGVPTIPVPRRIVPPPLDSFRLPPQLTSFPLPDARVPPSPPPVRRCMHTSPYWRDFCYLTTKAKSFSKMTTRHRASLKWPRIHFSYLRMTKSEFYNLCNLFLTFLQVNRPKYPYSNPSLPLPKEKPIGLSSPLANQIEEGWRRLQR
jgi:hypothetical protein